MKKLKKWILIKPYKLYASVGMLITAVAAYLISKTVVYENNAYVNIIITLIVKNELFLIILAILFIGIFIVENMLAKRLCSADKGGDAD